MSNLIGQSVRNKSAATVATVSGNGRAATEYSIASIYAPIQSALAEVENTITSELRSDCPEVELLLSHSRDLGGKRLRPALVLLTGQALGSVSRGHIFASAALEMIHLATLIHDDVLDNAKTRRHKETAHSKFGTRRGVLLGDYLFTHSFSVGTKSNSIDAVEILAQASNLVCEGEIKQNAWQSNFSITESAYLRMIAEKTGELCAAGCGIGAILSNAEPKIVEAFKSFGRDLGVAFQIIDDVLDLVGDAATVGKTLGTDLKNRKVTLPVIHALSVLNASDRAELLEQLGTTEVPVDKILTTLHDCDSIGYAKQVAMSTAQRAVAFASALPTNEASKSLVAIGTMTLNRAF